MTRLLVVVPSDTDPPARLGEWLRDGRAASSTSGTCDAGDAAAGRPRPGTTGCSCSAARSRLAGRRRDQPRARPASGDLLAPGRWPTTSRRWPSASAPSCWPRSAGARPRGHRTAPRSARPLVAKRDAADDRPGLRAAAAVARTCIAVAPRRDRPSCRPGATLLASNPVYANQAFRVGRHVYGLQFHIETTPEIVRAWAERDPVGVAASRLGPRDDLRALPPPRTRTSRRSGRPSPAGSPTWSAPRAARPPEPRDRGAEPRRSRAGPSSGWSGSASRTASGPPGCCPTPQLGLWDLGRNEPADPEAAPVVSALARAGDPDLALSVAAPAGRGPGPARTPSGELAAAAAGPAARVGAAAQPAARGARRQRRAGRPPGRPPRGLDGARRRRRRPGPARPPLARWSRQMLLAVGADPDDPPWGVRLGTPAPDADAVPGPPTCGGPTCGRCSSLAGRDLGDGLTAEEVAGELADIAGAVLVAGLALAVAEQPAGRHALPARGHRPGQVRRPGAELRQRRRRRLRRRAGRPRPTTRPRRWPPPPGCAATLMRVCHEAAWEVDAALRPGGQGRRSWCAPLAGHVAYYEQWASTWEFQALLKMRPVAGDPTWAGTTSTRCGRWSGRPATGPASSARCRPCAAGWRRNIPPAQADRELKLGRGGLRDVEFAVQLLQLVHGRADATLRTGGTLPGAAGAVGRRVRRAGGRRHADRLLPLPAHRRAPAAAAPAAAHPPAAHRRACSCAGWPARWATSPTTAGTPSTCCRPSWRCTPARCAGCTRSCSTGRCCPRSPGCPASSWQLGSQGGRRLAARAGVRRPRRRRCGTWRRSPAGCPGRRPCSGTCCRCCCRRCASCADPDAGPAGLPAGVSEALGGNQWYLRLLRDEGQVAERLAQLLGSSQYVAGAAHPHPRGAAAAGRGRGAGAARRRRR